VCSYILYVNLWRKSILTKVSSANYQEKYYSFITNQLIFLLSCQPNMSDPSSGMFFGDFNHRKALSFHLSCLLSTTVMEYLQHKRVSWSKMKSSTWSLWLNSYAVLLYWLPVQGSFEFHFHWWNCPKMERKALVHSLLLWKWNQFFAGASERSSTSSY